MQNESLAADVNGDQNLDLVVACSLSNDAYVLLGDGQGRFAAPRIFGLGAGAFGLVAADISDDLVRI